MRDKPIARRPVILVIMDGYGLRKENHGNAINQAKKPNLDKFFGEYPFTHIDASGLPVGLPDGQMGNSEVGHLNMGAGRVIYQPLTLISKAIDDGTFFTNPHYIKAMERVKENGGKLHVFGLTSDGGVHAHMKHIEAIIKMAKMHGLAPDQLCYHAFLDGRDVPPQSSVKYLDELAATMVKEGIGHITSLGGRYWGMDRDKNLNRVDKDYRVLTMREGNSFTDYHEYIKSEYARLLSEGKSASDEFVNPAFDSALRWEAQRWRFGHFHEFPSGSGHSDFNFDY
jgi:2,3-bisphosphoglycerate-independent phosphoglycerate mutase